MKYVGHFTNCLVLRS